MHAIARSHRRGRNKRAEAIIDRMNELYSKTGNKTLLPDKVSYTSLIKSLMADRTPGVTEKCKSILKRMDKEFLEGNLRMKPDLFTYGTILNAISYEGHPEECEELIDKMEMLAAEGDKELYPNIHCYNTVMNAYGKRRRHDSPSQTERILRRIDESRINGNTKLEANNVSYTICIDALARSYDMNKIQKAETLLGELLKEYNKTQKESLFPSLNVWNTLMLVYAESKLEDKAEKALHVLSRLEDSGNKGDSVSYNSILKACSKSNSKKRQIRKRVLEISHIALHALRSRKDLKPDSYTYNSLLWISDKFIDHPEERRATIKALFQSCCNDGEVNKFLIGTFKKVAPRDLFLELIGDKMGIDEFIDIQNLPREWTRNSHGVLRSS